MDDGLLKPGEVLNNTYEIVRKVGDGGTGEVYEARNTASERTVAIKILKAQFSQDPKFIDLMRRELLHSVSDDAVVRYYDLLRTAPEKGGNYFLVMDFIDGPSLADVMERGPVEPGFLMTLARRVSEGLAACHAARIFHRDISPDNIILRGGDPAKATLIDFGIAKDVTPDAKTVVGGGFAGKYEYAAPEQLDGVADARSDIYSFGMTLLAAARGSAPQLGTSFLEIVKAKHAPVDVSDVPAPLGPVIAEMVRPAADDRPQTAREVLTLIERGPVTQAIPRTVIAPAGTLPPHPPADPAGAAFGAPGMVTPPAGVPPASVAGAAANAGAAPVASAAPLEPVPASTPGAPAAGNPGIETLLEPEPGEARPAAPPPAAAPAKKRGKGRAIAALLLLALVGGGAWWATGPGKETVDGYLNPLPVADPYRFEMALAGDGTATASGNAPSADAAQALAADVAAALPLEAGDVAVTAAKGVPNEAWSGTVAAMARALARLESGSASVEGLDAEIEGTAPTPQAEEAAREAAEGAAEAGGYALAMALELAPQPLAGDAVDEAVASYADCGPITASGAERDSFAPGAPVALSGAISEEAQVAQIEEALAPILDGRALDVSGIQVINPSVCRVRALLPPEPNATIALGYTSDITDAPVEGDAFRPDDFAIIHLEAPADLEGYLYAFIVDNEFNALHLRPAQTRPENEMSEIGEVEDGVRRIPLTWPRAEGSRAQPALGFSEPYGAALAFALVSDAPLFPFARADVEDVRELAPDLAAAIAERRAAGGEIERVQRFILVDESG